MLALRFAMGFLVQIAPCAVLCAWPFTDRFRHPKTRSYATVALFLIGWDALFTFAGAEPLSQLPYDEANLAQNVLFLIALIVLLAMFVRAIDASVTQKVFVFLVVACYGYAVTQLGDIIAGFINLPVADKARVYDPAGLIAMTICSALLFAPMVLVMNRIRALLALPVNERTWMGMCAAMLGALTVLMAFEIAPKFYMPVYVQDVFLSSALAFCAAGLLAATVFIAHSGAVDAQKRLKLTEAALRHEEEAGLRAGQLAQAHLRIAELESEVAHLESALADGEGASADDSAPGPAASASEHTQADEEPLTLTSGNQAVSFLASDMMYAESLKRVRIIHLANGESFRVNLALAQLIEMLPSDRFAYCHRSIVVNLDYVRDMGAETLTLENGTTIPMGRRRVSELRQALSDRRSTIENARS